MSEFGQTVFGKILRKEIPASFLYEDELAVAILDINPAAPVHFLVIPKKPIPRLSESTNEDKMLLGHLLCVARNVAQEQGLDHGYRVIINDGPSGGQEVYHIHVHVLGKRKMSWPPG